LKDDYIELEEMKSEVTDEFSL